MIYLTISIITLFNLIMEKMEQLQTETLSEEEKAEFDKAFALTNG